MARAGPGSSAATSGRTRPALNPSFNTWGINVSGDDWQIGGTAAADRNIVTASSYGMVLGNVTNPTIQGTLIGVKASGTSVLATTGGTVGVTIYQITGGGLFGGSAAGAGNVLGGMGTGLFVQSILSGTVTVQGNRFGTDGGGTVHLGNRFSAILADASPHDDRRARGPVRATSSRSTAGMASSSGRVSHNLVGVKVRGNSIHDNGADRDPARRRTSGSTSRSATSRARSSAHGQRPDRRGRRLERPAELSGRQHGDGLVGSGHPEQRGEQDVHARLLREHDLQRLRLRRGRDVPRVHDGHDQRERQRELQLRRHRPGRQEGHGHGDRTRRLHVGILAVREPACRRSSTPTPISEPPPTATASSSRARRRPFGRTGRTRPSSRFAATSTASALTGPAGASYSTVDAADDYGPIIRRRSEAASTTETASRCSSRTRRRGRPRTGTRASSRRFPPATARTWKLHLGDSFADVPRSQLFYKKIETVFHKGITVGCDATHYCPDAFVARDQMAIFIARAIARGGANVPASGHRRRQGLQLRRGRRLPLHRRRAHVDRLQEHSLHRGPERDDRLQPGPLLPDTARDAGADGDLRRQGHRRAGRRRGRAPDLHRPGAAPPLLLVRRGRHSAFVLHAT